MSKKRQYTKEAIDNAIQFVQNKDGSIREASKKFGVPRSSIQFKIQNPETKFKSGPDPVLTEAEEKALCDFIIHLAKRGFPRKKEDIQVCVQEFLKENPRPNPFRDGKPGDVWFKAFLKRHPNLAIRTSEGVTSASACVSEKDIRKWFQEIEEYFDNEGLNDVIKDPARMFNADETGFNVCPKTGKVLAEKGCKNVYEIEKGPAKENITVMFAFSASGQICNPMIIYPYKRIPDRVTLSVPSGWGIGRSDTGWMTAAVFYDYIANCFYKQLLDNNTPLPVILFVDGHKTHITMDVSELCRKLKIHLVALYPNATRILQPADVAAFRPIKAGWKRALREWYAEKNYALNMTKETFAPLLKTVVDGSTKKETLINGFRVSGLFPFDANNVDYSKCIATATESRQIEVPKALETNVEHNECPVLTYSEFCNIVGDSIIQQCRAATENAADFDDQHFRVIYRLWQKFNGLWEENNEKKRQEDTNIVDFDKSCAVENVNLPKESEITIFFLDEFSGDFEIETENIKGVFSEKSNMNSTEDPVPMENLGKITDQSSIDGNNNTLTSTATSPKSNIKKLPTLTNSGEVTPCDIPLLPKEVDPNNKIVIISNEPLSDYLKKRCPVSPKRQGKRQTEKLPFALTSDQYVEKIKAKQLKKQEEEAAKENRKKLREEKKKQKETDIVKKKTTITIKKNRKSNKEKIQTITSQSKNICCDHCLSPILRRIIECSQCSKRFHLNCIPPLHQIHVPEDEGDAFLCHKCYKESNTD